MHPTLFSWFALDRMRPAATSLYTGNREIPDRRWYRPMLIDIGEVRLNYTEWGSGDTVVFIHGNLACGMWFDLVGPLV
jgi:hypothetical protein